MAELWRHLFELGVHAHYAGQSEIGRWACEHLLSLYGAPDAIRSQTRRNQVFYSRSLADLAPSTRVHPLALNMPDGWSCFNPSIAACDDGYRAIVRSSNYVLNNGGYIIHDDHGIVRTRNYSVLLDMSFGIRAVNAIDEDVGAADRYPSGIVGFEDCRLSRLGEEWYVSCTSRELAPGWLSRIALLRLDGDVFRSLSVLNGPDPARHEKNWMPLVMDGDLFFIYSCRPTVVARVDRQCAVMYEVARADGPPIADAFRGGTQAALVDGGLLFVVHESVDFQEGSRVYLHRLVRMTRNFVISDVSLPFYFLDRGVEFCAGLAVRDDTLVLSFGHHDREAYVATMRLDEALALLRPIP